MSHFTGFVLAVPTANRQKYIDHAKAAWPMFRDRGALRMVEGWGLDVPHGKQTDFYRATQARDDETVVFSWVEWPDQATAERAFAAMMEEDSPPPGMEEMPFDGARMFWGGFDPVVDVSA